MAISDGATTGRRPASGLLALAFSRKRKSEVRGVPTGGLFLPALMFIAVGALTPMIVIGVFSVARFDYGFLTYDWNLDHYRRFFSESTYYGSLLSTFWFIGFVSLLTVVVTLPFSYFVATKVAPDRQILWLAGATIPFFTSYLVRVVAFLNLLGDHGVINFLLLNVGLIREPLAALDLGRNAVVLTFVYLQSPVLILMAFVAIRRIDGSLRHAAADLGARPGRTFALISLPLMMTGLANGFLFAFISMIGDYVTPVLVGGTAGFMYINILMNQFGSSLQWDFGAALAVMLLVGIILVVTACTLLGRDVSSTSQPSRVEERPSPGLRAYAVAFLVFQYAPIALLLLLALNSAEFVGLPIKGLTLHWFIDLASNQALLSAFALSLKVAAVSVTAGVVLGGLAGIGLARGSRRLKSSVMPLMSAPLLLPPVILGIGIVITMAAVGAPFGWWRIAFAHSLLTIPTVAMVVIAQLQGMGSAPEIAAMDLGAKPLRAFVEITLPQLTPAILAGAFLAFAISMDEFILTFLVTGNDATLPIFIYTSIRFKMSPEIVAASAVQIILSFAIVVLGMRMVKLRTLIRAANGVEQ